MGKTCRKGLLSCGNPHCKRKIPSAKSGRDNDVAKKGTYFFAYFFLNLSIRPAVSTNMFLPVKKGCEVLEISSLIRGYSLPSSHLVVSLLAAVERLKKL